MRSMGVSAEPSSRSIGDTATSSSCVNYSSTDGLASTSLRFLASARSVTQRLSSSLNDASSSICLSVSWRAALTLSSLRSLPSSSSLSLRTSRESCHIWLESPRSSTSTGSRNTSASWAPSQIRLSKSRTCRLRSSRSMRQQCFRPSRSSRTISISWKQSSSRLSRMTTNCAQCYTNMRLQSMSNSAMPN